MHRQELVHCGSCSLKRHLKRGFNGFHVCRRANQHQWHTNDTNQTPPMTSLHIQGWYAKTSGNLKLEPKIKTNSNNWKKNPVQDAHMWERAQVWVNAVRRSEFVHQVLLLFSHWVLIWLIGGVSFSGSWCRIWPHTGCTLTRETSTFYFCFYFIVLQRRSSWQQKLPVPIG